jgi:hypothetical protein
MSATPGRGRWLSADFEYPVKGLHTPRPERALSEGPESLDLEGFARMMESFEKPVRRIAKSPNGSRPGAGTPHTAYEDVCELV